MSNSSTTGQGQGEVLNDTMMCGGGGGGGGGGVSPE